MWAIVSPYLIKLGISLAFSLFQWGLGVAKKTGMISSLEANGIQVGTHIIQATRVEDIYPDQVHKNGV